MKVVTSEEMRDIDRKTIRDYKISGSALMEKAGLAVAAKVKELFEPRKIVVLSGGGNNGGDGIVAARNLHEWGWDVKVFIFADKGKLSDDCLMQYKTALKAGATIEFRKSITKKDIHSALVVDAIFGTGVSKDVTGETARLISFINTLDAPIISVDIPSGISSDTGQILGEAVMADYTVTFGLPKRGHLLYPGAEYIGKLFVEDIGFPEKLLKSEKLKVELLERNKMSLLIPERRRYSHKGDYGHVLIVAGSRGKTGAAFMCAKACLRAGAGLVTIGVPETLMDVFQSRVTEEMTLPLPDRGDGSLSSEASKRILKFLSEKADVLAIGPGISVTDEIEKIINALAVNSAAPMIMDADAINALRGKQAVFKKAKAPIILTPHTGEMASLVQGLGDRGQGLEKMRAQIEKNRIDAAMKFSEETGAYLVLKGVPTVIAEPEGKAFINPTGNPGMASAGAGDVLTGMISGFLGQGLNPIDALILGVYMHGLAGDIAAGKKGEHSLIASDIIDSIPEAVLLLRTEL